MYNIIIYIIYNNIIFFTLNIFHEIISFAKGSTSSYKLQLFTKTLLSFLLKKHSKIF